MFCDQGPALNKPCRSHTTLLGIYSTSPRTKWGILRNREGPGLPATATRKGGHTARESLLDFLAPRLGAAGEQSTCRQIPACPQRQSSHQSWLPEASVFWVATNHGCGVQGSPTPAYSLVLGTESWSWKSSSKPVFQVQHRQDVSQGQRTSMGVDPRENPGSQRRSKQMAPTLELRRRLLFSPSQGLPRGDMGLV